MYAQEIQIIKEFFSHKFLHAVPGWIEGCAEFFVANNRNYSCNQLQDFAFEQWKLADLREMGTGCLPPNLNTTLKTVLHGKYAIQIEWIRDIGHASYAQWRKIRQSNNANEEIGATKPQSWEPRQSRMIQIKISDGVQTIQGIEYKRVPVFDQSFCPGTKALIIGPVECRRGMLLLEEQNIEIVGGEVDSLIISNAPENILARVLGLPVNPNPNINFNPGNEDETQDGENESTSTQQTPSLSATRPPQQGCLSNGTRTIQQTPSSSNANRPLQQNYLSNGTRTIQTPSSSANRPLQQNYLSNGTRTNQQTPSSSATRPAQQMLPPNSARTMGQIPASNTSRTFQQIPQTNTSRTVPQPNLSTRSVTNGYQDFSRNTVDNSDDLLNDEEILGEDMLAHLSALENEYLSEKEPPEVIGAFHDDDFIEELPNIEDNILLRIPDVHIAEDRFKSSNSSTSFSDKGKKKVTFGSVQQKSPATSQRKITNFMKQTPVKQQPSTSSAKSNYMSHTNVSKMDNFMSDSGLQSEFTSDDQVFSNEICNKASKPNKLQSEFTSDNQLFGSKKFDKASKPNKLQSEFTSDNQAFRSEMFNKASKPSIVQSEFTSDNQGFSSEIFDKASKPSKVQGEMSRNSSTHSTGIVTSSSPFVYLKQIKTDINIPKTYRAKVFILTLISELELKDDEWVLYAKLCDGSANLDVQLSSSVMEKLLNLSKETLLKWKPHIQTNKEVREELKMKMKTAEHRLIHFNNLVDIKVEPGKKMPCVTEVYEVSSEDMQALKLRLEYLRDKCVPT